MALELKRHGKTALHATVRALGAAALVLASACGGGGGTTTPAPSANPVQIQPPITTPPVVVPVPTTDDSLRISFDTANLTMTYALGDAAPEGAVVNATGEGQSPRNLFVTITTPTGQADPNIADAQVAITGMSARIVVKPKAGLAHGVYKGELLFRACSDAACTVNFAGSPWKVSYVLTVTFPYATLDTRALGIARTLVYDAVRGDIYASYSSAIGSLGLNSIVRFRASGTGWTTTALSIPGLQDIAMPPDASVLVATDLSSHVHLIDLASFSVKSSYLSADGIGDQGTNTETAITFTSDNKLWMPTGSSTWHGIGFFDLKTLTFGTSTPACTGCYGGPYFAVSRDGSRLVVTPSASISPTPPVLYMDAAEGVLKTNPAGLDFFYFLTSLSDNGDRLLTNGYAVYDRAFGSIGTVPQPASGVRAAQLSPDGQRAYVLSYAVEPGSSTPPLVQVFDTSAKAGTPSTLPLIGTFSLPQWPGCKATSYPNYACYQPRMRITPDGSNLLLLGDEKLIVAPIPTTLDPAPVSPPPPP